ncbi:MAG: hypothetical protein M1368_01595 [Thaumarchaeota archaeon]|nr:hypothetical protein [Nitrososphaerota archaeon]
MARSSSSSIMPTFMLLLVFFFSVGILAIFAYFSKVAWSFFFTVFASWVIADFTYARFISGGSGIGRSPMLGGHIQKMWIVYVMSFVGIMTATLVSTFFSEQVISFVNSLGLGIFGYLFLSFITAFLVLFDMLIRLYKPW